MNLEVLQHDYNKALEYQNKAEKSLADAKTLYEVKQVEAEQSNTAEAKQEAEDAKQALEKAQSKVETLNITVADVGRKIGIEMDLAESQLLTNSDDRILDELGIDILSTKENQDRSFQIGNYAHEHAEEFISESKLPRGLDNERTIVVNGETVRLDRVDWQEEKIYEIKPETTDEKKIEEYTDRLNDYVEYMNQAHPREDGKTWTGEVVYYNPKEVEAVMIDKGLLSEKSQELDISQKKQEELKYQDQVIDQTKDYGYGY